MTDCDAVIVGSGPGGSSVADVLTAAGWSVVILERGRNHLIDLDDPTKLLGHYSNDEVKFLHRHFLGPDPLVEPRTFRRSAEHGDREYTGDVNNLPATVGGGGPHADGKLPRFREEDFALVTERGGIDDAALADWPLTYADLEPFYAEAERLIGVQGRDGANPFAAWRSSPFPMAPGAPMYAATVTSSAAAELGYHPYAAPAGINSVPYDSRPACNNCGFCAFFGCPIHAKGDPVASLQRALLTGRCEVRSETFASRVVVTNGRATGVDTIEPDGSAGHVSARHVVLAAGAMETPRLALLSGIGGDLAGRHLMFHFQTFVMGAFDRRMYGDRGPSVTTLHDDPIVPDEAAMDAANEAGLPWIRGGTVEHAGPAMPVQEAKIYPWGAQHPSLMKDSALRQRAWGFCMQGEDLPQPTNRVDLDPSVVDARGLPVARTTYLPHKHEFVASAHHAPRLAEILTHAGAQWTVATTSPAPDWPYGGFVSPVSQSKHVMGTMRMGSSPATSVCDEYGRLHDVANVVVADSSVFVTSAGYNPTLTLVALALRAAQEMTREGHVTDDPIIVDIGKAKITLDELGMVTPGMARLMAEVGPRMHKLYYAGAAGNWPLARYFHKESQTLFEIATVVRPKYDENMTKFLAEEYAKVGKAIEAKDGDAFEAAFHEMVSAANAYHDLYDKPFLKWKLPDTPPGDLDLTPRS